MKRIYVSIIFCWWMTFTSCNQNPGTSRVSPEIVNNPITAAGTADTSQLPVFDFESTNHEFGSIKEGEVVTYNFKFKNSGKSPLIITSANASCGCTVPEYSKDPVAPGGNGFIKVTFNSEGKHGMVSKTVTLLANTIPNTKVLTISADITKKEE